MTPSRPVHERVLLLECEGDRLLGIVSEAAPDKDAPIGVVIVVGGPQYRAGSHRQFVQLARELADPVSHVAIRCAWHGRQHGLAAQLRAPRE